MDVNKFIIVKVVGVVFIGGLVVGFGSVVVILVNLVIEDIIVDFVESVLESFGGIVGDWCDCCLCCFEFICMNVDCFCGCECCECCGVVFEGCECFLGGVCELIFGCFCGFFDM